MTRRDQYDINEEASRRALESHLTPWICAHEKRDYGLDVQVRIVSERDASGMYPVTPFAFAVQLKSADKSQYNKDGSISYGFDTRHIESYLREMRPVILVLYAADTQRLYWHPATSALLNGIGVDQKSVTVRFAAKDTFDANTKQGILDYVRRWLTETYRLDLRAVEGRKFDTTSTVLLGHLLFGKMETSAALRLERAGRAPQVAFTGLGYTDEEFAGLPYNALTYLGQTLLVYDRVLLGLQSAPLVYYFLRREGFDLATGTHALGFISHGFFPVVVGPENASVGELHLFESQHPDGRAKSAAAVESRIDQAIAAGGVQFHVQAERDFFSARTAEHTSIADEAVPDRLVLDEVQADLANGHITKLFDLPFDTSHKKILSSERFKLLRLCHYNHLLHISHAIGVSSTLLPPGGSEFLRAKFYSPLFQSPADQRAALAEHVLEFSGLPPFGELIQSGTLSFVDLLRFRASAEGAAYRSWVHEAVLDRNYTGPREFISKLLRDGGLPRAPRDAIEKLRLLCPSRGRKHAPVLLPAAEERLVLTQNRLAQAARKKLGVGPNKPCPCGSGKKTKKCCRFST